MTPDSVFLTWWKKCTRKMWWHYASIQVVPTSHGTWTVAARASATRKISDVVRKTWTGITSEKEFQDALWEARLFINRTVLAPAERITEFPLETYIAHALIGEAFSARMYSENPDISPETKRAYLWAEEQFLRISRREVGERDLIG